MGGQERRPGIGKARHTDSKFCGEYGCKDFQKSSGEVVPNDEPLFLLRGRDILAVRLLIAYLELS